MTYSQPRFPEPRRQGIYVLPLCPRPPGPRGAKSAVLGMGPGNGRSGRRRRAGNSPGLPWRGTGARWPPVARSPPPPGDSGSPPRPSTPARQGAHLRGSLPAPRAKSRSSQSQKRRPRQASRRRRRPRPWTGPALVPAPPRRPGNLCVLSGKWTSYSSPEAPRMHPGDPAAAGTVASVRLTRNNIRDPWIWESGGRDAGAGCVGRPGSQGEGPPIRAAGVRVRDRGTELQPL